MNADPSQLLAKLAHDHRHLEVKTLDLCFLAGLYLQGEREARTTFEEDTLVDLFEQICDLVDPGIDQPRKRATHAIQRFRDQRLLARVDGAGLVRAGEYALTRLATAVIEFYLAEEELTRESLTLLTHQLSAQLAAILSAAKHATAAEAWRLTVTAPLQVTIAELVRGIERRQRGMDAQQEEIQAHIAELLQSAWFEAVDRCQELLDKTAATLRELNTILMRDTSLLIALLQEIQALASAAGEPAPEAAAQRVIEHIDRIVAWGGERQRAWSSYYQNVHRFLREVVRLDPSRALSQRLRDQLVNWSANPLYLVVADAAPHLALVPVTAPEARQPVSRERRARDTDPDPVAPEDAAMALDEHVAAALAAGAETLAAVTSHVLPHYPSAEAYVVAGRVAHALARCRRVRGALERPWRPVTPTLVVEDWTVLTAEPPRAGANR